MIASVGTDKQAMKASKPAMEKRRRARINESLQQLKALVLDGLNKNNSRHSKLEKADILEMTVRYLRSVQRQQVAASMETDPTVITQYRTGFAECMGEVSRYLGGAMEENPDVRARLIGHLAGFCASTNQRQQQRQQQQQQQPARYAPVTSAQGTSTLLGTSRAPSSSSRTPPAVVMDSAASGGSAHHLHQHHHHRQRHHGRAAPVSAGFQTPPLSAGGGGALASPRPVTLLTSPAAGAESQGSRTAGLPKVLSAQAQTPSHQRLSPRPRSPGGGGVRAQSSVRNPEAAASGEAEPPAAIARGSPVRTAPTHAPQPTGETITLILPSQSLPGGQVPTHLIPVYAQQPAKGAAATGALSLAGPEALAPPAATPRQQGRNPIRCPVPDSAPSVAPTTAAPFSTGQPAAWTAVPLPTQARLVSPQAGSVAPSALALPFAFSVPLNAQVSPSGPAVRAKQPAERLGRPIPLPGVFAASTAAPGDGDPMWRPW